MHNNIESTDVNSLKQSMIINSRDLAEDGALELLSSDVKFKPLEKSMQQLQCRIVFINIA